MFNFFKKKKVTVDIELLRKKANNNDKDAQLELGLMYKRGISVEKNYQKASYWLEKSINNHS